MLTLTYLALLACAQPESDANVERERQAAVAVLAPAKAKQLTLWHEERTGHAALQPKPLLRWSNPTAGSVYGEVFLWTHGKRPVAVASIFRWYHPFTDSDIEFTSLSQEPVGAEESEDNLWTSKKAGIRWQRLDGSPPDTGSAAARLGQMRSIGRRFTARLLDSRGGDSVSRELRLLQQPLYRYADEKASVLDGGLFAFVEVTDPEAWLLLEAVQTNGKPFWRYAAARMNADDLEMRLDSQQVASWEKIQQPWKKREAPYTSFNFDPGRVRVAEQAPQP